MGTWGTACGPSCPGRRCSRLHCRLCLRAHGYREPSSCCSAHRASPRSLSSGAAALATGASSRLSQGDQGGEGSRAVSRDAGLAPRQPPTSLFYSVPVWRWPSPLSWLRSVLSVAWQKSSRRRTSLMSGGPDRRLSSSPRRPLAAPRGNGSELSFQGASPPGALDVVWLWDLVKAKDVSAPDPFTGSSLKSRRKPSFSSPDSSTRGS